MHARSANETRAEGFLKAALQKMTFMLRYAIERFRKQRQNYLNEAFKPQALGQRAMIRHFVKMQAPLVICSLFISGSSVFAWVL
jgi:hypothetical protein